MRSSHVQPRRRPPQECRAFTLLELMIALFMTVILTLSLYASIRIAFRSKASAEAAVEPPRAAALALDVLGQDIESAIGPTTLIPTSFEATTGSDDRGRPDDDLQFFTVADSPLHAGANGDIKSDELTVVTSPNGRDHLLVRKIVRNLLSTSTTPNPDVEVICGGVGSFHLQYYNGDTWADTWDSTQEDNTLPAAVQVTLTLERTDATGAVRSYPYTRVFPISCSTAAQDSTVNPNATVGLP
jgi:type II secretory pathway pseudopilin PulG